MAGARQAALRTLHAVDTRGAYADLALESVLQGLPELTGPDRRLATELAYGTVRRQNTLDWALSRYLNRPLASCDPWVRAALRLGAYQLLYMENIPGPVAVNETVKLLHRQPRWLTGLVNAVLRRLSRHRAEELPYPALDESPAQHLALVHSHPEWIVAVFLDRIGLEETASLCRWNNQPPRLTVRINTLRTGVDAFTRCLDAEGIRWKTGLHHPAAVELLAPGNIRQVPGFAQGHFQVQDEASMIVAQLLDPKSGQEVLDACAAPGGKAMHLAELVGVDGRVVANDINEQRLQLIRENALRLGLCHVEVTQGDARRLPQGWVFDRVLLDAPCSGLGVLARRPDARWRKKPRHIPGLTRLQRELLEGASACVRPGGVLVYSVCTLTGPEGPGVVEGFLQDHPQFRLDDPRPWLPSSLTGAVTDRGYVELWPQRHGTDGFFMARLAKYT
ncbi:MAG: 16S rRNA (cytosine(967)-C(5))-methyltransferase RsmB [Bacillota bacterium]